jgi:hypothetical protein
MRIARRRDWSETEVDAMIKFIEARRPGFWKELLELQRQGGDLQHGAGDMLSTLIAHAHPGCELSERTDMKAEIRKRMSKEIGPG